MRDRFRSVVGWEKFAGQWLLRLKLAEPELTKVWPGTPSIEKPEGELRTLAEQVLTRDEVTRAVTSRFYRDHHGFTENDAALLWQARPMRDLPAPVTAIGRARIYCSLATAASKRQSPHS